MRGAVVVELAGKAERLERAAIPGHRDDGAVEAGGADRLVQRRRGARHLDDGICAAAFGEPADGLGDLVRAGIEDVIGAAGERQFAAQVDPVDADDGAGAVPAQEPDDESGR